MSEQDKSNTKTAKPSYINHRKRMRNRITTHGAQTLADYELLEVLLFAFIPRRDTKDTAKNLLSRFQSFRKILAADIDALCDVPGIGRDTAIYFNTLAEMYSSIAKEEAFDDGPILKSWDAVIKFLQDEIGMRENEHFVALFLSSNNKLLNYDILASGTVNRVTVYPREIVKSALKYHAVSVIIAHNHPSGDITPSKQDITMTNNIRDALKTVDITLHDHVIVSFSKYQSFKQLGLL